MFTHLSRSLALVSVLSLTACAAGSAPGDEGTDGVIDSQLASSQSAFSFFVATKAGRGFSVTRLNGGWMRCAGGWYSDTCPVAAVELTTTGLSQTDTTSIVDGLGHDAKRPTMIFVGRIVGATVGPKLEVFEMWRAPVARKLDGDVLHVSHAPMQAVWVNDYDHAPATGLTFARAPMLESCGLVDGEELCAPSYQIAQKAAQSKVGLLVVGGMRRDGTVVGSQYFVKVALGDKRTTDGFNYCKSGQTLCDDGSCEDDPVLCHANTGTGRGQFEAIRFDSMLFRSWLVFTSQATTTDFSR